MKKKIIAIAALLTLLSASFASADVDVNVGVDNNNTNTNNNNAAANSDQTQEQNQRQNQTMKTPTQLMNLQYGTNFVNPGQAILSKDWALYYSAVNANLSTDKVNRMRRTGFFSKLDVEWTEVSPALSVKPTAISMMQYWPDYEVNPGDDLIYSFTVSGKPNLPDEALIGEAASRCLEHGSDRYAILATTNYVGVSDGNSVSLGGATSTVFSNGTKGGVVAAGGQVGKIKTYVDEKATFKVKCMNVGLVIPPGKPAPKVPAEVKTAPAQTPEAPAVVKPETKPEPLCDTGKLWQEIRDLEQEVQKCTRYCYNNLTLRQSLGDHYIDLYVCTGDRVHLQKAIYHYGVAERNYLNGHDIRAHQAEANQVIAQVYYNWAGCINILQGQGAAMSFANAKKLERIPSGFSR
jgi:hypothetical protein